MRSLYLALASCCFCGGAQAFDTTLAGTVASSYVASQVTSAPFDNKLILDARDDAARRVRPIKSVALPLAVFLFVWTVVAISALASGWTKSPTP